MDERLAVHFGAEARTSNVSWYGLSLYCSSLELDALMSVYVLVFFSFFFPFSNHFTWFRIGHVYRTWNRHYWYTYTIKFIYLFVFINIFDVRHTHTHTKQVVCIQRAQQQVFWYQTTSWFRLLFFHVQHFFRSFTVTVCNNHNSNLYLDSIYGKRAFFWFNWCTREKKSVCFE